MSQTPESQSPIKAVLKDASTRIEYEVQALYEKFRESVRARAGEKLIDTNISTDTKYCYATDIELLFDGKIGLRVVCVLDLAVYEDEVRDDSNIKYEKDAHIMKLHEILSK
jgi:hypothetical protein